MFGLHTVLIVDDERDFLSSMRRLLRKEPYSLLFAENGREAIEVLQENQVSLVLADYLMPGMDGVELLKEVRLRYPRIITIMLTALSEIDVAMSAVNEAGVYKFLLKPVEPYSLKLTLQRALEFLDLTRERDDLHLKFNAHDAMLQKLEHDHPGITRVERDEEGCYIVDDFNVDNR
jgi:two-component system, probable response regulator PhcQ